MQDHPPTGAGAGAFSASVPQLARLLKSADKAVMLAHIHDLLTSKGYKFETVKLDEREVPNGSWVRYPIADWHEQHFTWLGKNTVNTLLNSLRDDDGLLLTTSQHLLETQPKYDRTLWYTLNYDALDKLLGIEPENLKTQRNKRLDPDDPNRTPAFSWNTPRTNATAEQEAPQTTPRPGEPTQDVTAARVEQAAPRSHDPSTYVIKRLDGTNMEWESGRDVFVCSVQAYMDALEQRWRAKGAHEQDRPHPRNYPNIITEKDGRRITLHVTKEAFRSSEGLQNAVAAHFGWKKRGKRWERR